MIYAHRIARNRHALPVFGLGLWTTARGVLFSKYIQFDTFRDKNNTNVTAHTMDLGPGWTQVNGTGVIGIPGGAGPNLLQWNVTDPGGVGNEIVAESGAKDATVVVACQISDASSVFAAIFRYQDASNFWVARLGGSTSIPGFSIYEKAAGTFTRRAYSNFAVGTGVTHTISVTFSGAQINATLDGANAIAYGSAATDLTATKHGIYSDLGLNTATGDFVSFYGVSVP